MTGINTGEHVILLAVKIIKIRKSNYYKEACFTHKKDPRKLWSTINEVPMQYDQKVLFGCKLTHAIGSTNSAGSFLEYLPDCKKLSRNLHNSVKQTQETYNMQIESARDESCKTELRYM